MTPRPGMGAGRAGQAGDDRQREAAGPVAGRHLGRHLPGADQRIEPGDHAAAGARAGRKRVQPGHHAAEPVGRPAADAGDRRRRLQPAGPGGAALPLPRPLRQPEEDPPGPLPVHRLGPGSAPGRPARHAGSRLHRRGSLSPAAATDRQLPPADADPAHRLAAAGKALQHVALVADPRRARLRPAGVRGPSPAAAGQGAARAAAHPAPRRALRIGPADRIGPARRPPARVRVGVGGRRRQRHARRPGLRRPPGVDADAPAPRRSR